jgi:hypothetical protein
VCVAQRKRSASAARAQRELSAPAPAHEGASTQKPAARTAEPGAAAAVAAARGTSAHPRTKPVAPALARRVRQVRVEATRKPAPPALAPACAAACRPMRNAALATARRAVAVHPHVGARPRNTRAWRDTREGGREIHHHPTSLHAGAYVRVQHAAAGAEGPPRATELASSEQARRVRSGPPRELRGTAPEGREGRAPSLHLGSILAGFDFKSPKNDVA